MEPFLIRLIYYMPGAGVSLAINLLARSFNINILCHYDKKSERKSMEIAPISTQGVTRPKSWKKQHYRNACRRAYSDVRTVMSWWNRLIWKLVLVLAGYNIQIVQKLWTSCLGRRSSPTHKKVRIGEKTQACLRRLQSEIKDALFLGGKTIQSLPHAKGIAHSMLQQCFKKGLSCPISLQFVSRKVQICKIIQRYDDKHPQLWKGVLCHYERPVLLSSLRWEKMECQFKYKSHVDKVIFGAALAARIYRLVNGGLEKFILHPFMEFNAAEDVQFTIQPE